MGDGPARNVVQATHGDRIAVMVGPHPGGWENPPYTSIAGTTVLLRTLDGRTLEPWKLRRVWVEDGDVVYDAYAPLPPGWKLVQEGCDEQVDR